ncbi:MULTISPECIES: hypothetical protein [unclassified Rathayibacter]|jgi:hypothetical protein|uniref:hypothetical protein n=1 Tax=unclassified Rathayibacter TaxID=2609250 RepID=UPI000FBF4AD1|nr:MULTISPECIES: hypothetical protein [unclassified Rathayibacter]ROP56604.1 hypothetical protein EDF45_0124 [Rathayibacter sp. PhB186]ROS54989.1 hypothetical protein EDF44_0124 [Rathayibacter sp. PhB185]TCL85903.1 hypothetical protein EDF49_101572 [Rathayibacter sp. PhB192]TCM31724.1 hypothetical protein EDF43_101572 [Rathayibacter sp. PhB179]TDX81414.1 hypothetical protein EDF35_1081 [Rathayibacter sp. PhB151]
MVFTPNPGGYHGRNALRRPMRGPKRDRWMWWRLGSGVAATVAGLIALLVFTSGRY